jgi:hypothetical protein
MRVDRADGTRVECTLAVDFGEQRQGAYPGSYTVICPDGRRQDGSLAAGPFEGDWLIDAVPSPGQNTALQALDGCNWEAQPAQLGIRLSGGWLAGGCPGSAILGGLIDLAKDS